MNSVDTMKALEVLGWEVKANGAYYRFRCPQCEEEAVIKAYGEKKNVWFCPKCKGKGHIISLFMQAKETDWEGAKKILSEKTILLPSRRINKELNIEYELEYDKFLEDRGIPEDLCKILGVGRPKGKTMLSGCIAFTVFDEEGKRVAYYGVRIKDQKPVFHHSFNPELYLYRFNTVDPEEPVLFTPSMFEALLRTVGGEQAISNFALPYLSETHLQLLSKCSFITFSDQISHEILVQAATKIDAVLRFTRPTEQK